ncbi:hypothetical protein ACP4OV_007261 [Aristida adscensionis]
MLALRPAPAAAAGAAHDVAPRLRQLRDLRGLPLRELVARVAELHADEASPVRKHVAEIIGQIGSKHVVCLPDMIPCLLHLLDDETPAVARQAIKTGTNLFAKVLEQLVIQGLFSTRGIDDALKLSWEWLLKFKSAVLQMAFQTTSNEGVRLWAVKFVERTVLIYTQDPDIPPDPPNEAKEDMGFNVAWLRGGHPLLNVGDLAMEASQNLGLLLEQLKSPKVKSLSTSMIVVFVSSLSAIAQRRPSFYGRILPVLLSLDPASSIIKLQVPGAFHALKSAFSACLKCTHSSAEPWRARLLEAQNAINQGDSIEHTANAGRNSGDTSNKEESWPPMERSTDSGNKRSLAEDVSTMLEDDGYSSKKVKQSHDAQEHSEEAKRSVESASIDVSSDQPIPTITGNSEAVYQLIGMFAALAAQGERAAGSLQILSSSIASDLLAEVVMVNMQHMPVSRPEVDQKLLPSTNSGDGVSFSSSFPLLDSLLKRVNQTDQDEVSPSKDSVALPSVADDTTAIPASSNVPTSVNPPMEGDINSPAVTLDIETAETTVPSVVATGSIDIPESSEASHASTEPQGTQEHAGSFISSLPVDNSSAGLSLAQSSETQSPSSSTVEANQSQLSLSSQYVLPKLVVNNIDISDEAKDLLQKEAFVRILQSDKQEASGSLARLPLLAHLGVEFPLELDPWGLLQKHALSDYVNNEGHELTLCILNRLYREAEQDQDFLSSRTATSVYESFVLSAENLRDMFPASDKSLGKLLCEIPYLPEGVLKLLEDLCSPGSNEKQDKDIQTGDRITQGLSAVWNLIMLRPSNRYRCLEIALQSTTHHLEEVRMKAIRLVANKLFPVASISKKIEDFANEKLNSVLELSPSADSSATERATPEGHQDIGSEDVSTSVATSLADAQALMSLYFALCTKKHSLLRHVFEIYGKLPEAAKQAVSRQVPILIRTVGPSRDLLGIISDPPADSRDLLMQVLQTLTDVAVPSQDLISSIKNLYSKTKDIEVLFAILAHLPKEEVLPVFPSIVNLPMDKFQTALSRILQATLQGSPRNAPTLDPSEILIAIHVIDPDKEGIPLKKVIDACAVCFEQRAIFTQQVLAKALNQLVEQIPLPLLFMRTVMQAIGAFPALVDFVMEIMSRLVSKQIWKYPKLWVGFLKCAILTKPQSYGVLLQLPAPQLENALTKNPTLKTPLVEHANQSNVRSTLPRSTLVVLGLAEEQQQPPLPPPPAAAAAAAAAATQAQSSQNQAAETSSSAADTNTEVTQESSAVS